MNVIIESKNPEIEINNEHIDGLWVSIDKINDLDVSGWLKTLLEEKSYIL